MNYPTAQIIEPQKEDRAKGVFDVSSLVPVDMTFRDRCIAFRIYENLTHVAFWLDPAFDWTVVKDNRGDICLVPLKKLGS